MIDFADVNLAVCASFAQGIQELLDSDSFLELLDDLLVGLDMHWLVDVGVLLVSGGTWHAFLLVKCAHVLLTLEVLILVGKAYLISELLKVAVPGILSALLECSASMDNVLRGSAAPCACLILIDQRCSFRSNWCVQLCNDVVNIVASNLSDVIVWALTRIHHASHCSSWSIGVVCKALAVLVVFHAVLCALIQRAFVINACDHNW